MSESKSWSIAANHVQNGVAVGGKLGLASDGLFFAPHALEKFFDQLPGPLLSMVGRAEGSQTRAIPFAEIASIGTLEGGFSLKGLAGGGLRDRLLVTLKDSTEEIFVVSDLQTVITHLNAQL
jgi:hypothetical protein